MSTHFCANPRCPLHNHSVPEHQDFIRLRERPSLDMFTRIPEIDEEPYTPLSEKMVFRSRWGNPDTGQSVMFCEFCAGAITHATSIIPLDYAVREKALDSTNAEKRAYVRARQSLALELEKLNGKWDELISRLKSAIKGKNNH